jgi:ankyrin repeat protein
MLKLAKILVSAFFLSSLPVCFCAVDQTDCASLLESAKRGDLARVRELIGKGADVNCRGEYGYTPLLTAVRYNRLEVAENMIAKGAKINIDTDVDWQQEEWGFTPLLWAVNNSYVDMVALLLGNGASVGRQGRGRDVPLIIAARNNCLPLVDMLIAKGAKVDESDETGGQTALSEAVAGGYLDIMDFLIRKGADIKRRSQVGGSMLSVAAGRGHFSAVRYLCEKGLPVNSTDGRGVTPIFGTLDSRVESRYILEYLLERGADVSVRSADGTTPLMVASHHGNKEAAETLIAKGADAKAKDKFGGTALQSACRGIGYYQGEEPAKRDALISLLLDNGAEVNTQDRDGRTPLMEASIREGPKIVGVLLANGALPNVQDRIGRTALMSAADANQTEVIKLLVKHGADLNVRDSKGQTALSIAKESEQSRDAYELLKSLGAKSE